MQPYSYSYCLMQLLNSVVKVLYLERETIGNVRDMIAAQIVSGNTVLEICSREIGFREIGVQEIRFWEIGLRELGFREIQFGKCSVTLQRHRQI